MTHLSCVGRDGKTRVFDYQVQISSSGDNYTFKVRTVPPMKSDDFFELELEKLDTNTVCVIMAHHHNKPEYAAKGIPEALLPEVKRKLEMNVESSPMDGKQNNVFRTPAATKYWERLVATNGAIYDNLRDVYTVV